MIKSECFDLAQNDGSMRDFRGEHCSPADSSKIDTGVPAKMYFCGEKEQASERRSFAFQQNKEKRCL